MITLRKVPSRLLRKSRRVLYQAFHTDEAATIGTAPDTNDPSFQVSSVNACFWFWHFDKWMSSVTDRWQVRVFQWLSWCILHAIHTILVHYAYCNTHTALSKFQDDWLASSNKFNCLTEPEVKTKIKGQRAKSMFNHEWCYWHKLVQYCGVVDFRNPGTWKLIKYYLLKFWN